MNIKPEEITAILEKEIENLRLESQRKRSWLRPYKLVTELHVFTD